MPVGGVAAPRAPASMSPNSERRSWAPRS